MIRWNAECLLHETAPLDCVELPGIESWLASGEVLVFFRGLPIMGGLAANDNREAKRMALTIVELEARALTRALVPSLSKDPMNYENWVRQRIARGELLKKPVTTVQLLSPPKHVDEALAQATMEIRLKRMQTEGKIACTSGRWWNR